MSLKWTPDKPSAPGWFWWRGEHDVQGEVIEVFLTTKESDSELRAWLTKEESNYPVSAMRGQFAGPIPEPAEA